MLNTHRELLRAFVSVLSANYVRVAYRYIWIVGGSDKSLGNTCAAEIRSTRGELDIPASSCQVWLPCSRDGVSHSPSVMCPGSDCMSESSYCLPVSAAYTAGGANCTCPSRPSLARSVARSGRRCSAPRR